MSIHQSVHALDLSSPSAVQVKVMPVCNTGRYFAIQGENPCLQPVLLMVMLLVSASRQRRGFQREASSSTARALEVRVFVRSWPGACMSLWKEIPMTTLGR